MRRSIHEIVANLPRCGAWSRSAQRPCRAVVVKGKNRCHYHGNGGGRRGKRTGAPIGSANALVHGKYSAVAMAAKRETAAQVKEAEALVAKAIGAAEAAVRRRRGRQRKAKVPME